MHFLTVKTTVENLPSVIDIDLINMQAASSILVRELPETKYKVVTPSSEAICNITKARVTEDE